MNLSFFPVGRSLRLALPGGLALLASASLCAQWNYSPAYAITNFSGKSAIGDADGVGTAARFNAPSGVAVRADGVIYVADCANHTIRRIATDGTVTTLAGSPGLSGWADGTGSAARFNEPRGIALDAAGNVIVADTDNNVIRRVTPAGVVTTLAGKAPFSGFPTPQDGVGDAARFTAPRGVALDAAGNIYVADTGGQLIRKITPGGLVTTLAGQFATAGSADGVGAAARFKFPGGIGVDASGTVYIADGGNATIRKLTSDGAVTTLAGAAGIEGALDGAGGSARFYNPCGLTVDLAGNVYVADANNHRIRKITSAGDVTTLAGDTTSAPAWGGANTSPVWGSADGTGADARFYSPNAVALGADGSLYVADAANCKIRNVTPGGNVTTIAGCPGSAGAVDGPADSALYYWPAQLALGRDGTLYVADFGNSTIRKITPNGTVSTIAGAARTWGFADGPSASSRFFFPEGVAVDDAGVVFVADTNNQIIRRISPDGNVSTLAGAHAEPGSADGTGTAARFSLPRGLAVDKNGNLYVADSANETIRKITPAGVVTTLAGTAGARGAIDGTGSAARFASPVAVTVDNTGNVYVSDAGNAAIRRITPDGVVSTYAGALGQTGTSDGTGEARFLTPGAIGLDATGNLYVADYSAGTIRRITPDRVVSTLAGYPSQLGIRDGIGPDARLSPNGLAVDGSGTLYISNSSGNVIRRGVPTSAPVITSQPSSTTASPGTAVTFSATASGPRTLSYQWAKNDLPIAGATSPTYTIPSVSTTDGGTYVLTVTSPAGTVRSEVATLVVSAAATHPLTDITVTSGHGVTFFAGSPPGNDIQWQISNDGGATWKNLSDNETYNGSASFSLRISGAGASLDGARYRYVAKYDSVVLTSNAATLSVAPAYFPFPTGLVADSSGNIFVTDSNLGTVQKISPTGQVTPVAGTSGAAGSADGNGAAARFNQPGGIALAPSGVLYVADTSNATIRRIATDGAVTTLAGSSTSRGASDGTGAAALFSQPVGLTLADPGTIYVADSTNHIIRKVTGSGVVTTFAGTAGIAGASDGTGAAASFNLPTGAAVDANGNVYVADTTNNTIRKITPAGVVSTFAGLSGVAGFNEGPGITALLNRPGGIAIDGSGTLFVADTGNSMIRRITPDGTVTTLSGLPGISGLTDGPVRFAAFNQPRAIAVDATGTLYVADTGNAAIRKISNGVVTTLTLSAAPTTAAASVPQTPTPAPTAPTPPTPSTPASSAGSAGGGGGAPSTWFLGALAALGAGRSALVRRQLRCAIDFFHPLQ